MTRKEEINKFIHDYVKEIVIDENSTDELRVKCDIGKACYDAIIWADSHPRKGLWDSEKVVKWLETNLEKFGCFNCFIEDHKVEPDIIKSLREAMEE